jgi:hypothetical protein
MLLNSYPQKMLRKTLTMRLNKAYIAFSQAIAVCRFEEVDSTPLEGFDANALMKS